MSSFSSCRAARGGRQVLSGATLLPVPLPGVPAVPAGLSPGTAQLWQHLLNAEAAQGSPSASSCCWKLPLTSQSSSRGLEGKSLLGGKKKIKPASPQGILYQCWKGRAEQQHVALDNVTCVTQQSSAESGAALTPPAAAAFQPCPALLSPPRVSSQRKELNHRISHFVCFSHLVSQVFSISSFPPA